MTNGNEPGSYEGPPGAQRDSRGRYGWLAAGFLGTMVTILLLGVVGWLWTGLGPMSLMSLLHNGATQIHTDRPTVVRQIQRLQRLETVSYTMDKIMSGEHENAYLPKFLAGDRLLLVVHGEVVAGVNLAELRPDDVAIHGQKIAIRLPAAEILSTRIDNARTRVYSRDTGLFTSPDPNLESEVREAAERQLLQAAQQDGILKTAEENARSTVTGLLKGFGFTEVEVKGS